MKISDRLVVQKYLHNNSKASIEEAFLAGVIYERRASARLALSINDAMAHAVGKLIRSRASDAQRHRYE